MIKNIFNILAIPLCITFFSCQQENVKLNKGEVPVKLFMDGDFTVNTTTKTDTEEGETEATPWENTENYSIQVLRNTQNGWEKYAGFSKFSELPADKILKFQYGEYAINAWWGVDNVAAFDSPFYYGQSTVSLDGAAINSEGYVPVTISPKLANTKLTINFTKEFQYVFRQYVYVAVQIYTEQSKDKPLVYTMDETRDAYLRPASIYLKLSLKKFDGTRYSYGLCTIADVKPQDYFNVSLKADTDPTTTTFNITVNESTNRVTVSENIPFSSIVKEEPKIKLSFISPLETVCQLQENQNPKLAAINTDAGLKDIVLNHNIEELLNAGVESGASILNPSISEKLKNLGIEINAGVENTSSTIIFTEFLNKVKLNGNDSRMVDFNIVATDLSDRTVSNDFGFKINKVEFTSAESYPGDIWTKEMSVRPLTAANISKGNAEKFLKEVQYSYSKDNGNTWTPFTFTSEEHTITGLTPASVCKIKYSYPEQTEVIKDITTYSVVPLQNGSLENYSAARTSASKDRAIIYNYTINDWANSNNITLSPNKKHNYNNWPSVESTTDAVSGRAVVIQSICYGGNTFVDGSGYITDKISAGALFLGGMNGQSPVESIGFNSRPTHLYYKYKFKKVSGKSHKVQIKIEHRDESGNVYTLGEGAFNGYDENTSSWTENRVEINYNSEFKHLAPTNICVAFISAQNNPVGVYTSVTEESLKMGREDVEKYYGSIGALTWPLDEAYLDSRFIGNRLWLDEVSLEYNK